MQIRLLTLLVLLLNTQIVAAKSMQRERAEAILSKKCMDCHSDQTVYPWYAQLPIVQSVIQADIDKGKKYFHLEKELFAIEDDKDLPKYIFARLTDVIKNDSMPPIQYRVAHWDKVLTKQDKQALTEWLDQYSVTAIKPLPDPATLNLDQTKVALGKKLFHDTRLSGDNSLSCASCHDLAKGGTDQAQFSTGINGAKGHINSPTVFNSSFNLKQFWDGRADDLEAQAHGPVHNPIEMGSSWDQVLGKLKRDRELRNLSGDQIANAIAEFEKSLITHGNAFDRYLAGDTNAISAQARHGYELFKKHDCNKCHNGAAVGGASFEKMGLTKDYFAGRELSVEDQGRFNATKDPMDKHKFKVPILRNVKDTYPYFHDGSVNSLNEAVAIMAEYQIGKKLNKKDIEAIVEFLETL
ncbi:MAG: c-type cytochrome [Candidatus Melainabacteria bacterium]|nr:c-type cytochrome [Candidatus Melainabacteria bacterium]